MLYYCFWAKSEKWGFGSREQKLESKFKCVDAKNSKSTEGIVIIHSLCLCTMHNEAIEKIKIDEETAINE